MRPATTLLPALHALLVHRLRTSLALLSICIGVASVVLVVVWGAIGQAKINAQIKELGARTLVILPGAAVKQGVWRATGSLQTITEGDADAIAQEVGGIVTAAPLLRGQGQVVYGNRNRSTVLRGATPAWFEARPWPVTMGRPLTHEDVRRSAKVVLLAHGIAKELFGDTDPIDHIVRIKQIPFTVIGILEEKGHSLAGEDIDDQVIFPISTARKRVLGYYPGHPTAIGGITLRVADDRDMDRTGAAVRELLRQRHRLGPALPDDFVLRDLAWAERAQSHSAWLITLMLAGAAAISLVVGGIGIMNVMLVSVNERRQEIGLRMTVGARRRDISRQFLIEAGLLALLGSGAGLLLALGIAVASDTWQAFQSPETVLAIVAAVAEAVLVTVLSGFYPARKASLMDPVQALGAISG